DEYYTSASWRGTWQHDGGTLMNQATHGIDLLQWLLGGQPATVTGTLARYLRPIEADDFAAATVRFQGGGIGTINVTVDTFPRNLGTRLTILGERGTVELSGNGPDAITTWIFPEDTAWATTDEALAAGTWTPETSGIRGLAGHAGVYEDLAASFSQGTTPVASLQSSAVSAEIVLGIQQSHRDDKTVTFPVNFASAAMAGVSL
ncbi:MAG: Gfo/Idh/MocA family oxidoreductase, partial [Alkalispirochaeta sp.]